MDLPTQAHLMPLREALELRLSELRSEVQAAERLRRAPLDATEVGDRKDEALRVQAGDIDEAQERRDVGELHLVEAALDRMHAGRYGDCLDCGMPIGLERLRAQPAAERCAKCQRAAEHGAWRASA